MPTLSSPPVSHPPLSHLPDLTRPSSDRTSAQQLGSPAGLDLQAAAVPDRAPLVTIRSARAGDIPALCAMIAELAAHHGDTAPLDADTLARDLFGPVPWITALVAEAAGTLIGYAILVPLYRAQLGVRGMDLHHLFVRDAHRGTGIGRHLVAKARQEARRAGCAYLSVSAATGNVQAHRFYESEDFTPGPVTGMRYVQALR